MLTARKLRVGPSMGLAVLVVIAAMGVLTSPPLTGPNHWLAL